MEDAIMLFTGQIVPLSEVSDSDTFDPGDPNLVFFGEFIYNNIDRVGRLKRFKKGDTAYTAIFEEGTGNFTGYYSEEKFWDNNSAGRDRKTQTADFWDLGQPFYYGIPFVKHDDDMKVYFQYKLIEQTSQGLSLRTDYGYTLYKDVQQDANLYNVNEPQASLYVSLSPELQSYVHYILNKKFLLLDGTLGALDDSDKEVLHDIVYVWNEIFNDGLFVIFLQNKNLLAPFDAHINLPYRYAPANGTVDASYHQLYDQEYFNMLRLKLIDFRYWVLRYKDDYNDINLNDITTIVVNLFPAEELSYLSLSVKTGLIDGILKDNDWVIGKWYFNELNEEEALVKIVRSVANVSGGVLNYSEINDFMDLLNTPYEFDGDSDETLYEVLYGTIHDTLLFAEGGNKGALVKAIYQLWVESKFNPYHDVAQTANAALSFFNYTANNARWQFEDDTISSPSYEEDAAPMLLNYESERVLLWYRDNFTFGFKDNKICAYREAQIGLKELMAQQLLPGYSFPPNHGLYGTYHIFQPVAIEATNSLDTIVSMPVKGVAPNANPQDFIENCIPVFYLHYVDDLGDQSDAKETIGVALDVALTFTGIGNIAKLRHLKDLSKLRKFLLGTITPLEELALKKAVSGIASGFNALMGVAHLAHGFATAGCTVYYNNPQSPPNPSDPAYQEYLFCKQVDKWLFALEMLSLSGDLLARRALVRATRKLRESVPSHSDYDPIRNALNSLDELDAMLAEFLNGLQNPLYTKVTQSGWTQERQFTFMFDFQDQPQVLAVLNANLHLVDNWVSIQHLISHRRSLPFLKGFRVVTDDADLLTHVHLGDAALEAQIGPNGNFIGLTKAHVSGYHNPDILVPYPPGPGKISWDPNKPVENSKPADPTNGYTMGWIKRNMADIPDPSTNLPWIRNGNSLKSKNKKNVFWPSSYNSQRINEEMAYAFSNMDVANPKLTPPDKYGKVSYKYIGQATDGHPIQIIFYGGDLNNGKLGSIFPLYF